MKRIKQDELFHSLSGFLKDKGIALTEGVYAQRIQRACGLLGEAINATQSTASKAKQEVDKRLEQLRQSIHEATAPKSAEAAAPPQEPASPAGTSAGSPPAGDSAPKSAAAPVGKKKRAKKSRKRAAKPTKTQGKL